MNEAIDPKNDGVTVLNLYKRAVQGKFEGIWLPKNHQTHLLASLRRKRIYNKQKSSRSVSEKRRVEPMNDSQVTGISKPLVMTKEIGTSPFPLIRLRNNNAEIASTSESNQTTKSIENMAASSARKRIQNSIIKCWDLTVSRLSIITILTAFFDGTNRAINN